ncbi:universal stress protein [Fodinicurvata halophila]|uniref:Universal stress protein n=1 Tax=Fodinicurvata halophila TaxID=1419723 RepID=A0ABV8UM00_9PROT
MYKTVIVPLDLSHTERLQPMVSAARQLSSEDAEILLVNVIEDIPAYVRSQVPQSIRDERDEEVRKHLHKIAKENGLSENIMVRTGHAATEILAAAKEKKADLIVIASHKPGFGDFLIGSTAARVVRHAACTVHVVRETG